MQKQIRREAGLPPEEGGVDVPSGTDGVTRYPAVDGTPIPGDDLGAYDAQPPKENGNDKS